MKALSYNHWFFYILETSKSAMALHVNIEIFVKHGLHLWVIVHVKDEKVIFQS